jgi:hypothetical protein
MPNEGAWVALRVPDGADLRWKRNDPRGQARDNGMISVTEGAPGWVRKKAGGAHAKANPGGR